MDINISNNREAKKAIGEAERILREIRAENHRFLAATEEIEKEISGSVAKADGVWKKTEAGLKATEHEARKKPEDAVKALLTSL